MSQPRKVESLRRCGNSPALDFVNTIYDRVNGRGDYLADYGDLVVWARGEDILSDADQRGLLRGARKAPARAARVLREALQLRESMYRLFLVFVRGETPKRADTDRLNHWLARSLSQKRISYQRPRFALVWSPEADLERVLWPIVESAAELLSEGPPERLRACPADNCGWLFLDTSKNGTRRWCSMETCGNVAKARRHRARQRRGR